MPAQYLRHSASNVDPFPELGAFAGKMMAARIAQRISLSSMLVKIFWFAFKCRRKSLDATRTKEKQANNLWVPVYLLLAIVMQLSDKGVMCTPSDEMIGNGAAKRSSAPSECETKREHLTRPRTQMKTAAAAATKSITKNVDKRRSPNERNGNK